MTSPGLGPIIQHARCDFPKIAVLGTAFLALERVGLKFESRDDSFGMIRAKPTEGSGVTGSLIVRAWDSPPGSEMELLLEVTSPSERERASELLRAFIAEIAPRLNGFRLLDSDRLETSAQALALPSSRIGNPSEDTKATAAAVKEGIEQARRYEATRRNRNVAVGCLTVIGAVVLLAVVGSLFSRRPSQEDIAAFARGPLTESNIRKHIGDSHDIKDVEVTTAKSSSAVRVTLDPGAFWDDSDFVRKTATEALGVMEKLFQHPSVSEVTVSSVTTFTDMYGKKSEEVGTSFTIDAGTAARINWDGLRDRVILDWRDLARLSNCYIHPGIAKHLVDSTKPLGGLYCSIVP